MTPPGAPLLVGLGLLALLSALCIREGAPRIENELAARSRAALSAAGLASALVDVSGRDACLHLPAAEADGALRALRAVRGLRVIEVDCRLTAVAATGQPPFFRASRVGETITVDGALSAAVADAVAELATALAPGATIEGAIIRDAVAPAPWTDALPAAIRLVAARVLDPSLSIVDGTVTVAGRVPSPEVREGVVAELEASFPSLQVVDRLELRPPATAEELQRGLDQFVASRIVEFDFNSARLTDEGKRMVDEVAAFIAAVPRLRISIEGHTDDIGGPEVNQPLSERRAQAVREYLVALGIPADRFTTKGFGARRPVADNETSAGRQRNRRTEFHVVREE